MKLAVKCWKTKKDNKLVKGLFYESKTCYNLVTFDKFVIINLLGSKEAYDSLKEGDTIRATACLESDGGAT